MRDILIASAREMYGLECPADWTAFTDWHLDGFFVPGMDPMGTGTVEYLKKCIVLSEKSEHARLLARLAAAKKEPPIAPRRRGRKKVCKIAPARQKSRYDLQPNNKN